MSQPFVLGRAPESICVLRLSAIGDVCHMLAVVQAIQAYYPQTLITWIIGRTEASLLKSVPGIEFIVFDKADGWRAYLRLYQQLRGRRFDVLLHAQVALRASLASLCVRAKTRLGFDDARAKDGQWLFTNAKIAAVPKQHVIEGLFEFAKCLGVPLGPFRWHIPLTDADSAFAAKHCHQGTRTLVINPAASAAIRNWRAPRYAEVADYAIDRYGYQVILIGGGNPAELRLSAEIQERARHSFTVLTGKTTLPQALALIARADMLIAPDTGPAHMATMVGTPVIGLYANSNPRRTGPYFSFKTTVNAYPQALAESTEFTIETAPWGKRVASESAMLCVKTQDVKAKIDEIAGQFSLKGQSIRM